MIDAGTVAEDDTLYLAELADNVVLDWVTEKVAWDDAAVFEGGVVVGATVDDRLEITEGSTEDFSEGFAEGVVEGVDVGVDVEVEAGGIRLGVEMGVVEDAVVDGGTGGGVLEVEGVTTTGGACATLGL